MGKKREAALTPRQREWLGHLRACARGKETMRAYAKRHRLSEPAMYQAAKDLRRRGVLPPVRGRGSGGKQAPAFVKVAPRVPDTTTSAWRVRLSNGVVLEATGTLGREMLEALAGL
jgi:uncharacterized protein